MLSHIRLRYRKVVVQIVIHGNTILIEVFKARNALVCVARRLGLDDLAIQITEVLPTAFLVLMDVCNRPLWWNVLPLAKLVQSSTDINLSGHFRSLIILKRDQILRSVKCFGLINDQFFLIIVFNCSLNSIHTIAHLEGICLLVVEVNAFDHRIGAFCRLRRLLHQLI